MAVNSVAVSDFIEYLSLVSDWYGLGVLLGASPSDMNEISREYKSLEKSGCLAELYKRLEKTASLSWESITTSLRLMNRHDLANRITARFIRPLIPYSSTLDDNTKGEGIAASMPPPLQQQPCQTAFTLEDEYTLLLDKCALLLSKLETNLETSSEAELNEMYEFAKNGCGLTELQQDRKVSLDDVLKILRTHCHPAILNCHLLALFIKRFVTNESLLNDSRQLENSISTFKSFVNVVELLTHIDSNRQMNIDEPARVLKLKVCRFWNKFMFNQFEILVNELFQTACSFLSHVTVDDDQNDLAFSWIVPSSDVIINLIPDMPLELVQTIGVLSCHIGSNVIYDLKEEGFETIEAAMMKATELKNALAVELLLAVGCSVGTTTSNGNNDVTNIVNITEKADETVTSDDSTINAVKYVCIFDDNEHVEAIIDGREDDCSSCILNEKMIKQLQLSNEELRLELLREKASAPDPQDKEELIRENEELQEKNERLRVLIGERDAETTEFIQRLKAKGISDLALVMEQF